MDLESIDASSSASAAFDAWLRGRPAMRQLRLPSSIAIYRSMWGAFTQWCAAHALVPDAVRPEDIELFLTERSNAGLLSDRHAWRWLTLIDGVLGCAGPAPGQRSLRVNHSARELLDSHPRWRFANAAVHDPVPEHLSAADARRLVGWLMDDASGYKAVGARTGSWQALRNRTAVALQMGAGLTPGDIRVLHLGHVGGDGRNHRSWSVSVPAHGAVSSRTAPLAVWAARMAERWLHCRKQAGLPGDVLFPGTRRGTPWSKVSQYLAATSVLEAAGVAVPGGGSFLLRHTFALRQLRRGHPPDEVARWLGVVDPGVMARYERVQFEQLVPE